MRHAVQTTATLQARPSRFVLHGRLLAQRAVEYLACGGMHVHIARIPLLTLAPRRVHANQSDSDVICLTLTRLMLRSTNTPRCGMSSEKVSLANQKV